MKKKHAILLLLLLLLGGGTLFIIKGSLTQGNLSITKIGIKNLAIDQIMTDSISVMNDIIAMEQDTSLHFRVKFREGHVKKGKLEKYLTTTADGYLINLKNKSPVTTPTIIGNSIYVSGGFGSKRYYCFDFESGKLNWAIDLDDDGPSPSVFCDSLLIFNTESCTIFAINRFTGKMEWSHWLGDPLLSSPLVVKDKVYTSYPEIKLYLDTTLNSRYKNIKPKNAFVCLEAKSGKILWQKWLDGDVLVSPVSDGDFIYLTTYPGTVYKINSNNGDIIASVALGATSVPSIVENRIYITKRADDSLGVKESIAILDKDKLAYIKEFNAVEAPYLDDQVQGNSQLKHSSGVLDLNNGFAGGAPVTSGWQAASYNIGQSNVSSLQLFQPSTVLYSGGNIYNLMGSTIFCINPKDEKVKWKYQIDGDLAKEGGTLGTTPILSSNHLVTVSVTGTLLVFDLETGEIVFEKELDKRVRSSPVFKEGKVLIPTTQGELVCVDTKISTLDGWNMLMKNGRHEMN
jgi:outer membrane protein assembly factor BamB